MRAALCTVLVMLGGLLAAPPALAYLHVDVSGPWYGLRDRYTRGLEAASTFDICYATDSQDWLGGIGFDKQLGDGSWDREGFSRPFEPVGSDCLTGWSVNPSALPEGAHTYRAWGLDPFGAPTYAGPWTVYIDRTPPGFPLGLSAAHALWASGHAIVSWAPATDPALADGRPGAGAASYTVRTRRNGGAWSAPAQVVAPELEIAGVAGDVIDLEVAAVDVVGNIGAAIVAQQTLSTVDPCDPGVSPQPDVCQEPPPGVPVDDEPDPDIELEADEDPGARAPARVYRLQTKSAECKTNRCWTTIRNKEQSWATGMSRADYIERINGVTQIHVDGEEHDIHVTVAQVDDNNSWHLGGLSWVDGGCGWVFGGALSRLERRTDSHCEPGYRPTFNRTAAYPGFQSSPFNNVPGRRDTRGNNCYDGDFQWRNAGGQGGPERRCTRGTAIFLVDGGVQCANVSVLPDGRTRDRCRSEDVIRTITDEQASGYCVDWRYVTRDRRWVMVRDTHRTIQRGGWVFMPLSSFEPDQEKWPAYDERIDEDNDGETDDDRLPNERGTCGQEGFN